MSVFPLFCPTPSSASHPTSRQLLSPFHQTLCQPRIISNLSYFSASSRGLFQQVKLFISQPLPSLPPIHGNALCLPQVLRNALLGLPIHSPPFHICSLPIIQLPPYPPVSWRAFFAQPACGWSLTTIRHLGLRWHTTINLEDTCWCSWLLLATIGYRHNACPGRVLGPAMVKLNLTHILIL